jgi:hypothetical protein
LFALDLAKERHFGEYKHRQPAGTNVPMAAATGGAIGSGAQDKRDSQMKWIAAIVMFAAVMGCTFKNQEQHVVGHQTESVDPSMGHLSQDRHQGNHGSDATAMLMIQTEPEEVQAGQPATLRLMIHDPGGAMVKDFETVHGQKIHIIIVREGLDQFAHIHPQMDPNGNMTAVFTFPIGGKYRLYADHKPSGKDQATAIAQLNVHGEIPPAPELIPNTPGNITSDGLNAHVTVENAKMSGTASIVFRLTDSSDTPIVDLEPYMGVLGHLVVISADGKQYVHAHPVDENNADGTVEFETHLVMPGIYKGWGQFQRGGKVHIVPFVSEFSWDE